jgi:predicted N-formylglutamate amidohydrolase
VPARLHDLGLSARQLQSHIGWDSGALDLARRLAQGLAVPLHRTRWSRLVADCNRSNDHPKVIATRSDGVDVPGNWQLDAKSRDHRLRAFWTPYRHQVEQHARQIAETAICLHLSIHSFTPTLRGRRRKWDLGLLFDPARRREREVVTAMQTELRRAGYSTRKNFPYFGHTDGMTTQLRGLLSPGRYLGIEVELNQRLLQDPNEPAGVAHTLTEHLRRLVRS